MNDIIRTLQFEKEQLEARIRLLENKLESDNRQISEYDNELKDRRWISVNDKLPEIIYNSSEDVLIHLKNGEQYVAIYVGEDKDFGIEAYWATSDMHRDFDCDKVTHWQPLPEEPKIGGNNND